LTEQPVELLGLSRDKLATVLAPIIDRPFRIGQIYDAIHQRGARSIGAITTLRKDLREQLSRGFVIGLPEVAALHASNDGTRKFLFSLADGATIEAVDIPDRGRHTLCVSSQAGCALGCRFCVTGFWGAGRNLTVGEIVAQVYAIRFGTPPLPPSLNLVFMGMGEPLLNLANLHDALEILSEEISLRRITVSTAGVVPGIDAMARWERRPNLAVSLHAPDDERRDRIMPINKSHPIASLLEALARFPLEKGRRITFEYILIRDFNDSLADADALARLLGHIPSKINLIPANPDPVLGEQMVPPSGAVIRAFQQRLMDRGFTATVRRRRGDDVSAACGQLRAPSRDPRGFRGAVSL
jgi:23S rRNA (adenine2503-C2)-methyltransferase